MTLHELTFAKIILLEEDIAEVIVNDGVEIDMHAVYEYHHFLLRRLRAPFSLLINKINSYAYTLEAKQYIATLPQVHAMAVISYNRITRVNTENLASVPRAVAWNLQIFSDRAAGLEWLTAEQEKTRCVVPSSGMTPQTKHSYS